MTWLADNIRSILALVVVAAVIVMTGVLIVHPPMDNPVLNMAVGILYSGGFTTVINYFFGSSQASSKKDETISKLALPGDKLPDK